MSAPILVAENLSISFGEVRALDNIDLTIGAGEIRCLAGENGSGKSTFVKIVSGVYEPSTGTVAIAGQRLSHHHPREAIAAGVQVIYQDLSLFEHLSVAENIAFSLMLHEKSRYVNRGRWREIAAEQLERMGVRLPLDATVGSLSVANKQLVAIARALAMDARILFMDEPTTALTATEVARLLAIVHDLKEKGLSVVFISHKLNEVFEVADSITVFRDGRKVGDFPASELDARSLGYHMTGREIALTPYDRVSRSDDGVEPPLLAVEHLTKEPHYRDVSFTVRPGDVVGLTGLLGAGRTELALSLFGLNRPESGTVSVAGAEVAIREPWDAIDLGIALLPEDRKAQGLFNAFSIAKNISSTRLDKLVNRMRLLDLRAERELAHRAVATTGINNKNVEAVAGDLSGGNAQKAVIGKWMATEPTVFIMDSPTVGIDVGSKSEIYERIHELARQGKGVILISDEPEEIVSNCNRILVMHEGDVIAAFDETDRQEQDFPDRLARIIADPSSARADAAPGATR